MAEDDEKDDKEEYGISASFKIKRRKYTMSPEALEQRRANAEAASKKMQEEGLSTGPKTPEGKAASSQNNWKHGIYARTFFSQYTKPCQSTCPQYPCSLVTECKTEPGQTCLDKERIYETFQAILKAVKTGELDDLNGLVALDVAKNMEIIRDLQDAIMEDGVTVLSQKINKDGDVIGTELKLHPGLLSLPKLIEVLGITPKDLNITPKERAKDQATETGFETLADLMSQTRADKDKE